MNFDAAEKIANAVLYEGYMLYPYRPSAIKNQQRWSFGTLYPPSFEEVRRGTERSSMHVECLLQSNSKTQIAIRMRSLQFAGTGQVWSECIERSVEFESDLTANRTCFDFPASMGEIHGSVELRGDRLSDGWIKVCLDLVNESACDAATREQALAQSLISAHMIVGVEAGEFISLLDPPCEFRELVANCRNIGCFPVLVGDQDQRNMLLCSPIILYDYPQVAPESAGDFFDATEMDEMLTLRVLTMTPEEKHEMAAADNYARALLARTEQTAREQLMRTHGTIRSMRPVNDHE